MEILKLPDVHERLMGLSVDPSAGPPRTFAQTGSRMEIPRWAAIANSANVKLD